MSTIVMILRFHHRSVLPSVQTKRHHSFCGRQVLFIIILGSLALWNNIFYPTTLVAQTISENDSSSPPLCVPSGENSQSEAEFCLLLGAMGDQTSTTGVAWGDYDNDGDLDLAVANGSIYSDHPVFEATKLYRNDNGNFDVVWQSIEHDSSRDIAWGDYDGDSDLDLIVGNQGVNRLYRNIDGELETTAVWSSDSIADYRSTQSIDWADYDGDGDLDLAVGNGAVYVNFPADPPRFVGEQNLIYRNITDPVAGIPQFEAYLLNEIDLTISVAWGDYSGDGSPDLAVGNGIKFDGGFLGDPSATNRLYRTVGNLLSLEVTESFGSDNEYLSTPLGIEPLEFGPNTLSLAWGDYDGDGDLDLAAGNGYYPEDLRDFLQEEVRIFFEQIDLTVLNKNQVFRNLRIEEAITDGTPRFERVWRSDDEATSVSIAWGDYNSDGFLDLAAGNASPLNTNALGEVNRVYRNNANAVDNGILSTQSGWQSAELNNTMDLVWGDYDNDGDLDLLAGNIDFDRGSENLLYQNKGSTLSSNSDLITEDQLRDVSTSAAWGDFDNDGDLDLVVANRPEPSFPTPSLLLYQNQLRETNQLGFELLENAFELTDENIQDAAISLAWGDYDRDGYLDLLVGNGSIQINENNRREMVPMANRIYRNRLAQQDTPFFELTPHLSQEIDTTSSVAWGDIDGDGDLDLATGNGVYADEPNRIYRNDLVDGVITFTNIWSAPAQATTSIAWGDYDGDGDLDLATTNRFQPNRIFQNTGNTESRQEIFPLVWEENPINDQGGECMPLDNFQNGCLYSDSTHAAWGDYDGDGDLDLAIGNVGSNELYENKLGVLLEYPAWKSIEDLVTLSVTWGDYDNDGDLDLAAANGGFFIVNEIEQPNHLYGNDNGQLTRRAIWESTDIASTTSLVWGDVDSDGDLDLAATNFRKENTIYINNRELATGSVTLPKVYVARPAPPGNSNFYSSSEIWSGPHIPIEYTLTDPLSQTVSFVVGEFSLDGGGSWLPAIAVSSTVTSNLATSPEGVSYTYIWDVYKSGVMGQSDNVTFRLQAIPKIETRPNQIPGPYFFGSQTSTTYPFRIRGTQIRVVDEDVQAMEDAVVYKLPAGEVSEGRPIGSSNISFRTSSQGYLGGRDTLFAKEKLLALAPITTTAQYDTFITNGRATIDGLETFTVTNSGIQTITVSPDHPLILFDLYFALEWDASTDPNRTYLNQLEDDIQKASEYIYDFTNGQAALGHITVTQNAENWAIADVVIQATNRLRPYAVQGGMVLTPTVDADNPDVIYETGHVRMGASWNRYGNPGESLGEDWALTLAHELAHYLFFLEDTYLGIQEIDGQPVLVPIDACKGSVMGDMYDPSGENTEFLTDEQWAPCAETLANETLMRSEWATIKQFYPMLKSPDDIGFYNAGPSRMPFNLTEITVLPPTIETASDQPIVTLPDNTIFFLDYAENVSNSASARAYLLKKNFNGGEAFLIDLGTPTGGQKRLSVRGASVGDRLCVVDPQRGHFGCEFVSDTRERLRLSQDSSWQPDIRVTPVTSSTIKIEVANVADIAEPLKVRVFQELVEASPALDLVDDGSGILSTVYTATATITATIDGITQSLDVNVPLMVGHVQLWVNEAETPEKARREAFVDFRVGGNPGRGPAFRWSGPAFRWSGPAFRWSGPAFRWSGPAFRWSGPAFRWSGTSQRNRNAPVVSADGQMIFFTRAFNEFEVGDLYTVQSSSIPIIAPLESKVPIGLGYRLVGSDSLQQRVIPGSISFQYLGTDTLSAGITEDEEESLLQIHYFEEAQNRWVALTTKVDPKYNFASAASRGDGLYALLAGKVQPMIESLSDGWIYSSQSNVVTVIGQDFLAPVEVTLTDGSSNLYTPTTTVINPTQISIDIPNTLPPNAYELTVTNGDGSISATTANLSVMPPLQSGECFADSFESGSGQWQIEGEWGIVTLPNQQGRAMTDSPNGSYTNAIEPDTIRTTTLTSRPFDLAACSNAKLTFRHAYVIAQHSDQHQDWAKIEILTDGSSGWTELARYAGGGVHSDVGAAVLESGDEWRGVDLAQETISLAPFTGTAQLRITLESDQNVTDKGWVLDDLSVRTASELPDGASGSVENRLLLPLVQR